MIIYQICSVWYFFLYAARNFSTLLSVSLFFAHSLSIVIKQFVKPWYIFTPSLFKHYLLSEYTFASTYREIVYHISKLKKIFTALVQS